MWPTVLNTTVGVRAIPQDYSNVRAVLEPVPQKTLVQDSAAGDTAVHVHRISMSLGLHGW